MRLININAFFRRESLIHSGEQVDRRTKVLEFRDDETTKYAILSHRWIDPTEVDCEEMADLAKMDKQEQDEIRSRLGYKKIVDTCKQAKKDGYEWVWVDTCCIDKRSSAELSEAINSMYRWYANATICYAYLHDVDGSCFPTFPDSSKYRKSNGWPEWFSRGWTLQEMIAPRNLQFFNKDWQPIGDKRGLAEDLRWITEVPPHILTDGLEGNRPCIAQIISWAAKRTTTRVEDKAYSLMGLLDVNMPMLYGEGKKAFQRLQLEIIRSSNDRSIFAWGFRSSNVRIGSILADDPNDFENCSDMKLMDHNELVTKLPELSSINTDHFDVFPITNRGIQIWMPLCRYRDSNSVFRAYLPCRTVYGSIVTIDLVLWNSNYYRYPPTRVAALEDCPTEFHQVYLRYQDTINHAVTFEIDDSGVIENGFTPSHVDAKNLTRNMFTLTNTNPFCVKSYFTERGDGHFNIDFGQCLGLDWVHLDVARPPWPWIDDTLKVQMPGGTLSMADAPFQGHFSGRLWVCHLQLPGSTWIVRIYRIAWERSKTRLRLEVFRGTHPQTCLDGWNAYDVEKGDRNQDPRGLMLYDTQEQTAGRSWTCVYSCAGEGTMLGEYGYFTDCGQFYSMGNLFSDLKPLISEADITPRRKTVTDYVIARNTDFSLPNNPTFNSFLVSLAPRLLDAYVITRVQRDSPTQILCTIRKPLVWHLELIRRASANKG